MVGLTRSLLRGLTPALMGGVRSLLRGSVAAGGGSLPDVTTWSFDSNVTFTEQGICGVVYNDDGSKIYVGANPGSSTSYLLHNEPDLAAPYVPEIEGVPTEVLNRGTNRIRGIGWSSDGTKVYAAELGTELITEFDNAGAAYNPGAGDLTVNDTFNATGVPLAIYVRPDGTQIYYINNSDSDLYQINMSSADDLTTASMGDHYVPAEAAMFSVVFAEDGTNFYMLGIDEVIYEYVCGTPWDINTASYTSRSKDISGDTPAGTTVFGLAISPDLTKMILAMSHASPGSNAIMYYTR